MRNLMISNITRVLFICFVTALFLNSNAYAVGPKAYVANTQDNTVSVIDTSTNQVIKTISVPDNPEGMAITLNDKIVYVSSNSESSVSLIDTNSDGISYAIDVASGSPNLVITPDGSELIATQPSMDDMAIIDTATNKTVGKVSMPGVTAVAVDPSGEYAFANSQYFKHPSLNEFTIATNAMLFPIPTTDMSLAMSFSPDSKWLYYTLNGKDMLYVLDIFAKNIIAQIPVGAAPYDVTFTHNGKMGLVVSQGDGTLVLFNPNDNSIISKIKVGSNPHWIAVSLDDSKAYVTNEGSDNVSVVDLGSKKVVATIAVGKGPRGIVMQRV